jgi:hypothetical protein
LIFSIYITINFLKYTKQLRWQEQALATQQQLV